MEKANVGFTSFISLGLMLNPSETILLETLSVGFLEAKRAFKSLEDVPR